MAPSASSVGAKPGVARAMVSSSSQPVATVGSATVGSAPVGSAPVGSVTSKPCSRPSGPFAYHSRRRKAAVCWLVAEPSLVATLRSRTTRFGVASSVGVPLVMAKTRAPQRSSVASSRPVRAGWLGAESSTPRASKRPVMPRGVLVVSSAAPSRRAWKRASWAPSAWRVVMYAARPTGLTRRPWSERSSR